MYHCNKTQLLYITGGNAKKMNFSLNLTHMPNYIHTLVLYRITKYPLDMNLKKTQT